MKEKFNELKIRFIDTDKCKTFSTIINGPFEVSTESDTIYLDIKDNNYAIKQIIYRLTELYNNHINNVDDKNLKIWVDDIREAPEGYIWSKSVNQTIDIITKNENNYNNIILHLDHDAGDYVNDGGDYIKILDWLEETNRKVIVGIHSMNPVGIQNILNIIQKNNWKLIT